MRRARKVYTIGGNVNQSVTARKLNLRARPEVLGRAKGPLRRPGPLDPAAALGPAAARRRPREKCSLNDKKWFVLLQVR